MDAQQFDRLTQQFGRALTRRRFGAVLAALGIGAGLDAAPRAAAKKKHKKSACSKKQKQKCRRQGRVCEKGKCVVACNAGNSACGATNVTQLCGEQGLCDCSRLAEGGFGCAAPRPETCPAASECSTNAQCLQGEVCVDVSGDNCCGGESFGLCRQRCTGQPPGF